MQIWPVDLEFFYFSNERMMVKLVSLVSKKFIRMSLFSLILEREEHIKQAQSICTQYWNIVKSVACYCKYVSNIKVNVSTETCGYYNFNFAQDSLSCSLET